MPRRDHASADAALKAGGDPDEVAAKYGYPSAAHMRDSLRKWRKADPSRGPNPPRGRPRKYSEATTAVHLGAVPVSLKRKLEVTATAEGVSVAELVVRVLQERFDG